MAKITWKEDGWTTLQEANPAKHVAEIECRAEGGMVVEVRLRHSRGEETVAKVSCDGKPALPMAVADFRRHYEKDELDIR